MSKTFLCLSPTARRLAALALSAGVLSACGGTDAPSLDTSASAAPEALAAKAQSATVQSTTVQSTTVQSATVQSATVLANALTQRTQTLYVSPSGNDSAAGTQAAPLRTVQRCIDLARAGTVCVLRAGTYRETVQFANDGSAQAPIRLTAMAGEKAVISGADEVSGWAVHAGSIYKTTVTLPVDGYADEGFTANQVFAAGSMLTEARWPNSGTDLMRPTLQGGSINLDNGDAFNVRIVSSNMPNIPGGWDGATVWTNDWYVSRTGTVTGGSAGNLSARMSTGYFRSSYWYYLTGKLALLDAEREWHYDGATKQLYVWAPGGAVPSGIEVKRRTVALDLSGRSHVQVSNISLFAANIVTDAASRNLVLDNIEAKYLSHHVTLPPLPARLKHPVADNNLGIVSHVHDTGIQLRGANHVLRNSKLAFSSGNLVVLEGTGHTVQNNVLIDANYQSSYAAAVYAAGSGHRILRNTVSGSGRSLITALFYTTGAEFRNNEIGYNLLSRFGALSNDLGAIYVCCSVNLEGTRIHHNRIHSPYTFSYFWDVAGIYTDNDSYNATIDHNIVHGFTNRLPKAAKVSTKFSASERIFNNVFLHPVDINFSDARYTARNNVFANDAARTGANVSNNLWQGTDPQFLNAANADFRPAPGSPMVGAGVPVPGIADGTDIGAYRSGQTAWTAGAKRQ
jgi:Right handed beta helix region/Protein of unknown function (DUF1565)